MAEAKPRGDPTTSPRRSGEPRTAWELYGCRMVGPLCRGLCLGSYRPRFASRDGCRCGSPAFQTSSPRSGSITPIPRWLSPLARLPRPLSVPRVLCCDGRAPRRAPAQSLAQFSVQHPCRRRSASVLSPRVTAKGGGRNEGLASPVRDGVDSRAVHTTGIICNAVHAPQTSPGGIIGYLLSTTSRTGWGVWPRHLPRTIAVRRKCRGRRLAMCVAFPLRAECFRVGSV